MDAERRPAGFWVRFCAGWIDLTVVAVSVVLMARAVAGFGLYIPVEIVVLVAYALYTTAGIGWRGTTLGMAALGIRVERRDGRAVRWGRASIRAAGVLVSQCLLGLPFLTIGSRRTKRGWHDRLSGTVVILLDGQEARRRLIASAVLVIVAGWIAVYAVTPIRLYDVHRRWIADAEAAADRRAAASGQPVEAASVTAENLALMQTWLAEHGRSPSELVLDVAARHQVTIVGEIHGRKQYFEFFKSLIPDLYNEAGVRVIALECCNPGQNEELAELVNGEQFDPEKLKRIARGAVWHAWGYRQQWEVLQVVWQVNRARPEGQKPLRVVGICPYFDGPSFALAKRGPIHERLRWVRLVDDLPYLLLHDAHYARCVEREAFDRGDRTLVWVGAAHAPLSHKSITEADGRIVQRLPRMGAMLSGRYGDAVGQVILHNEFQQGAVAQLIEESARQGGQAVVAFAVPDSPFASLRDGETFDYKSRPGWRFSDFACNYVLLASSRNPGGVRLAGWLSLAIHARQKPPVL